MMSEHDLIGIHLKNGVGNSDVVVNRRFIHCLLRRVKPVPCDGLAGRLPGYLFRGYPYGKFPHRPHVPASDKFEFDPVDLCVINIEWTQIRRPHKFRAWSSNIASKRYSF